jgi:predicted metal-dependent hydrolase
MSSPPVRPRVMPPFAPADERATEALQLSLFKAGPSQSEGPANGSPVSAPDRRYARLNGRIVTWELRRTQRRTIGFTVDGRGLRISAPRWVSLSEIDRAMVEKANWILGKLDEWREHAVRRERHVPRWHDGAPIQLLGRTLRLRIDPRIAGVEFDEDELRVGLPEGAGAERVEKQVQLWLQQQARELFAERIPVYAQRLGRSPRRWALSSARTRWGSCAADGSIRLNWRLVQFPLPVVDYVIAHELAHLREMNHGPKFWSTVGALCPGFEQARAWLRRHPEHTPLA